MNKKLPITLLTLIAPFFFSSLRSANFKDFMKTSYGHYCGAGSKSNARPIDNLDKACKNHDECFESANPHNQWVKRLPGFTVGPCYCNHQLFSNLVKISAKELDAQGKKTHTTGIAYALSAPCTYCLFGKGKKCKGGSIVTQTPVGTR